MDLNSNFNQSLNGSGNMNNFQMQQNIPSPVFTPEQLAALQQMQLNAQMGNLALNNGLQPNLYPTQGVPGQFDFQNLPNIMPNTTGFLPGVLPLSPLTQIPMMPFPQMPIDGQTPQQPSAEETRQQLALLLQLQSNIPSAVDLRKTVQRDYIVDDSQYSPSDEYQLSPRSLHNSTPSNGSTPTTPIISSRKQLFVSETSSATSSGPTSPTGSSGVPMSSLSDYSPGQNSPKSSAFNRQVSEPHKYTPTNNMVVLPSRASSLKYEQKYPQDKCYRCMKKVYPVEKIGPIKDVVYHKGCFTCKTCNTKLNLKNFCHNTNEDWDIHVYCKSHCDQGVAKSGHFDANCVLIKGALAAPKLSKINEQIRGSEETHKGGKIDANSMNIRSAMSVPKAHDNVSKDHDGRYHLDLQSLEIAHARNVPATDLQTGNKIKNQSWTRQQRRSESTPPPDVVKYSDAVPEYDMESLKKLQIENHPDYDR